MDDETYERIKQRLRELEELNRIPQIEEIILFSHELFTNVWRFYNVIRENPMKAYRDIELNISRFSDEEGVFNDMRLSALVILKMLSVIMMKEREGETLEQWLSNYFP